jgi:hypothetical protein
MNKCYTLLFIATMFFSFSPILPESHTNAHDITDHLLLNAALHQANTTMPETTTSGEQRMTYPYHTPINSPEKSDVSFENPMASDQEVITSTNELVAATHKNKRSNKRVAPSTNQMLKLLL